MSGNSFRTAGDESMASLPVRRYRFGPFTLDAGEHRLTRDDREVVLQPKTFQALLYLLERHGHLVTKEELHAQVWGKVSVSDSALARCIVDVRRAIGDSAARPQFLQTVSRVGYRFVGEVVELFEARDRADGQRWNRGKPTLAVLPFLNLSSDPEQEYFADGFADLLITDLGRIKALHVISRTSAMRYRNTASALPDIGRELGVDVIVEGAVLRSGERVRITVQLIEAETDRHLWAESYERPVNDILRLQHEVARDVAGAIRGTLDPEEHKQLVMSRRIDPGAHEAYLKGRYFWHKRTPEAMARSVEWFRVAVERDPACAPAYAGLAHAQGAAGFFGYAPPSDAFGQMKTLTSLALSLDGDLAEGHAALGALRLFYEWDWHGAETAFLRALDCNPSDALAHEWYGWCLFTLDQPAKAIGELRRARELDPLSARAYASLAMALYFARCHTEALEQLHRAIELDPFFVDAHCGLGLNCEQLDRRDEAIARFERAIALSGRIPTELASLGHALALAGRRDEARQLLAELDAQRAASYVPSVYSAAICAALGEREEAFRWLDRAHEERSSWLVFLGVEPWWDSLRDDRRFHDLVRRVGLPSAPSRDAPPPESTVIN